jgi:serine/threonine-protein kinase SRPK3
MPFPALEADNNSETSFRFLLVNFDAEDLEMYRPGGFHPVHLGDYYGDNKRFRIVHKLGAGGFSTVWLARDEQNNAWVTLKIAIAEESTSIEAKSLLSRNAATGCGPQASFVVEHESFAILGPNGRHICIVLPVLGPSASQLSNGFDSRIQPPLCRQVAYQATRALSNLHAQGLCQGGQQYGFKVVVLCTN